MINDLPWQKPNSTEFSASSRLLQDNVNFHDKFVAYPWATWIDLKTQGKLKTVPPPEARSLSGLRATVCQHIWALEHLELFQRAGITDLFWSHATQGLTQNGGIRIHPFPLYPVRCASHPPTQPLLPPAQRPLLYSFQGAYAPGLYLTPVRDWLLELPPRPDAQLERRREWHYEQAVYREQVQGQSVNATRHSQLAIEADAYAATLQSSCFALCPSGSGPNSIRLWESLGYGAIPVILSDQLQLPGPADLWQTAAVVVPETQAAVAELPEQLEALASDHQRLTTMQEAGQLLWRRYGLDGFVGDVVDFLRDPLPVLRSRAQLSLPGDPVDITTTSPPELPLEVRRWLRKASPNQPLVIVIQDQGDSELLRIRWRAALQICSELIGDRPWSLASVSPTLETMDLKPEAALFLND